MGHSALAERGQAGWLAGTLGPCGPHAQARRGRVTFAASARSRWGDARRGGVRPRLPDPGPREPPTGGAEGSRGGPPGGGSGWVGRRGAPNPIDAARGARSPPVALGRGPGRGELGGGHHSRRGQTGGLVGWSVGCPGWPRRRQQQSRGARSQGCREQRRPALHPPGPRARAGPPRQRTWRGQGGPRNALRRPAGRAAPRLDGGQGRDEIFVPPAREERVGGWGRSTGAWGPRGGGPRRRATRQGRAGQGRAGQGQTRLERHETSSTSGGVATQGASAGQGQLGGGGGGAAAPRGEHHAHGQSRPPTAPLPRTPCRCPPRLVPVAPCSRRRAPPRCLPAFGVGAAARRGTFRFVVSSSRTTLRCAVPLSGERRTTAIRPARLPRLFDGEVTLPSRNARNCTRARGCRWRPHRTLGPIFSAAAGRPASRPLCPDAAGRGGSPAVTPASRRRAVRAASPTPALLQRAAAPPGVPVTVR
eukprot:scaffold1517_cov397-Prasinococcus_capsulatus_cf.AAC.5